MEVGGTVVNVGTRTSKLALIQTNQVVDHLKTFYPEITINVVSISTTGDSILDVAVSKIGEKGAFTKNLESALENNIIDLAVHSLKDLPATLHDGLAVGAILKRESPCDAVVIHPKYKDFTLETLPAKSVIGTSALRRTAQLKRRYPHLIFEDVRGPMTSRLKQLDEADDFAALIMAEAGLNRLGWTDRIHQVLSSTEIMYSPSQGALGVECRADDDRIINLLRPLNDYDALLSCIAERAFIKTLETKGSVPVAVHSEIDDGERLYLKGGVFSLDGSQGVTDSKEVIIPVARKKKTREKKNREFTGVVSNSFPSDVLMKAERLGVELAESITLKGGQAIIDRAKQESSCVKIETGKGRKRLKIAQ